MESSVAALAASIAASAAFAHVGIMLWRGSWLSLLVPAAAASSKDAPACRKLGRRMAVVLAVCCALMATLALFVSAGLAGAPGLASAATLANNAAFLGLVAALAWFFIVQRPDREREGDGAVAARGRAASLDHLSTRTIVFVIAVLAIIAAVGMAAAAA